MRRASVFRFMRGQAWMNANDRVPWTNVGPKLSFVFTYLFCQKATFAVRITAPVLNARQSP